MSNKLRIVFIPSTLNVTALLDGSVIFSFCNIQTNSNRAEGLAWLYILTNIKKYYHVLLTKFLEIIINEISNKLKIIKP